MKQIKDLNKLYKLQESISIKRFNALLNGDIQMVTYYSEQLDKVDDLIIELEERGQF